MRLQESVVAVSQTPGLDLVVEEIQGLGGSNTLSAGCCCCCCCCTLCCSTSRDNNVGK